MTKSEKELILKAIKFQNKKIKELRADLNSITALVVGMVEKVKKEKDII